jgi:transcription elongation GreA/GreB family factor
MQITKQILYEKCLQIVENKIAISQKSIEEAQQAANAETKSSAGDKYETTRAMMQIEIENCSKQLAESQKLHNTLQQIVFQNQYQNVVLGSLVTTTNGVFFLAIGIGKVEIELEKVKQVYFIISPNSPIGEKLHHKKVPEEFVFNGKKNVILSIE